MEKIGSGYPAFFLHQSYNSSFLIKAFSKTIKNHKKHSFRNSNSFLEKSLLKKGLRKLLRKSWQKMNGSAFWKKAYNRFKLLMVFCMEHPESSLIRKEWIVRQMDLPPEVKLTRRSLLRWFALFIYIDFA